MLVGVNQKITPLKYAFLIKPNSKNKFKAATEVAFTLWGGVYSPIIPIYKNLPQLFKKKYQIPVSAVDYYKGVLDNFSPDIIIYDDDLDPTYLREFVESKELHKLSDFRQKIIDRKTQYGIDAIQLVKSVIKKDFQYKRNDELRIAIPKIDSNNLYLNVFLGSGIPEITENITKNIGHFDFFVTPSIDSTEDIKKISGAISLLDLNTFHLTPQSKRNSIQGEFIYFIDENNLEDLQNYWNLRALGCDIIAIPMSEISSEYYTDFLLRFCKHISEGSGTSFIASLLSFSLTRKDFKIVETKLNEIKAVLPKLHFMFQKWFPRYWAENVILQADHVSCETFVAHSNFDHFEKKNTFLEFDVLKLPFKIDDRYYREAAYKVIFKFSYYDDTLTYAETIYGIDPRDWMELTFSMGSDNWNISKNGIEYFTSAINDRILMTLPTSMHFFQKYWSKAGYALEEISNGRLADEVFKNLGGFPGLSIFSTKEAHRVIELFEEGNVVRYPHLLGEIKRKFNLNDNDRSKGVIKNLVDRKIVEFGTQIQCPYCNQRSFYLLKDLDNSISCSICRNTFNLKAHDPTSIEWSFRGIGPFSKNNKVGGMLCVFFALKLLKYEFTKGDGSLSSLMEFQISKNDKKREIDLTVLLNDHRDSEGPPDLIIAECKMYKRFATKDFERLKSIGQDFPNAILAFCTLNEELEPTEIRLLTRLAKAFRKGSGSRPLNPIMILTGKELVPENYLNHFKEYKDKIQPRHYHSDYIGLICDLTVEKHLGLKTWGDLQTEKWLKKVQSV